MKGLITKLFAHKDTLDNLVLINQKIILKLDLHDDKEKHKVMKSVSTFTGIDSISMDMEENKLTIMGKVDPVKVVSKLRKQWQTYILIVGPAKEEENDKLEKPKNKNEGKKNEEPKKKEDGKNEEPKKEEDGKKEEPKQKGDGKNLGAKKKGGKKGAKEEEEEVVEIRSYRPNNPYYYVPISMEENPNACVIC